MIEFIVCILSLEDGNILNSTVNNIIFYVVESMHLSLKLFESHSPNALSRNI